MERISALMDGELDRQQAATVVPDLRQRDELREAWATYHLIGEAMRRQSCPDSHVASSVAQQLAIEPTVLAPEQAMPTSVVDGHGQASPQPPP